jgi:hypothetical protein
MSAFNRSMEQEALYRTTTNVYAAVEWGSALPIFSLTIATIPRRSHTRGCNTKRVSSELLKLPVQNLAQGRK